MPVYTGGPAPYAPPATVLQIINGFRERGLATPFTSDVLVRAGVTESLVPRVLRSLEGLDLIDDQGNPTPAMEALRRATSEEFKPSLETIIRTAYSEVFQFVDPATDPATKVADAFRAYNPLGQRGRMVTLFLGLCEAAGIIPEGAARKQAPGGVGRKKSISPRAQLLKDRRSSKPRSNGDLAIAGTDTAPAGVGPLPPAIKGLLASLPRDGHGWTQEQRDKWLRTFVAVLDFSVEVQEAAQTVPDERESDE